MEDCRQSEQCPASNTQRHQHRVESLSQRSRPAETTRRTTTSTNTMCRLTSVVVIAAVCLCVALLPSRTTAQMMPGMGSPGQSSRNNFDQGGGEGHPDCMTDLMRRAVLPNHFVDRYVEVFRQQGIDEALLADLPFTDMQTLFVNIGISRAGDRIKLFRCFNPVTQQNSMCARKQCENGGLCRYNVDTKHFGCSCTGDFWPPFCKTRKIRDVSIIVRELSEDVHRMKSIVSRIGVTYNRWGSTACPAGSELTYVGFMAGSYFSHAGGGANYLCLPFQPLYDRFNSGIQKLGQIAGTEYEFSNTGQTTSPLQDRNVPCSVCYASGRTTTLMVPARNDCPPKWIVEYTGYLMTAHHSSGNNHRSEYVCVDDHFETLPGYHGNTDGAHLWPVEAGCGIGLDCPPYHAEKELTCAVCTRQ